MPPLPVYISLNVQLVPWQSRKAHLCALHCVFLYARHVRTMFWLHVKTMLSEEMTMEPGSEVLSHRHVTRKEGVILGFDAPQALHSGPGFSTVHSYTAAARWSRDRAVAAFKAQLTCAAVTVGIPLSSQFWRLLSLRMGGSDNVTMKQATTSQVQPMFPSAHGRVSPDARTENASAPQLQQQQRRQRRPAVWDLIDDPGLRSAIIMCAVPVQGGPAARAGPPSTLYACLGSTVAWQQCSRAGHHQRYCMPSLVRRYLMSRTKMGCKLRDLVRSDRRHAIEVGRALASWCSDTGWDVAVHTVPAYPNVPVI